MFEENQESLSIGVGILRFLRDSNMRWDVMFKEWIDNSLGARARNIIIRSKGKVLEIVDDGDGCDDLIVMESPARSGNRPHDIAGMYGIGGVMSQIHASQGGLVEVSSVHKNRQSEIAIDWNECLESNRFTPKYHNQIPSSPDATTGTTIRIHRAKRFRDTEKIITDLGHDYAYVLRHGRRILFEIDGDVKEVIAYEPPPFDKKVRFDFDFQGHRIKGFCGVLKQGFTNHYPGWSVHWGYRVAMVTKAPAMGHLVNRIYGEIELPRTWKNIVPTKDDFTSEADDLWEKIGELCTEVLERGDVQSTDFAIQEASEIVGGLLTEAIGGDRALIKGRRPKKGEDEGTVEPSGDGPEHKKFTTSQPGYKPSDLDGIEGLEKAPKKIRIAWDEAMTQAYRIDITGTSRSRIMTIMLNSGNPQIYDFIKDPNKLVTICCHFMATDLTNTPQYRGMFPEFVRDEVKETFDALLRRVSRQSPVETS